MTQTATATFQPPSRTGSFFALWRADLRALLRDRRALIMTFALPLFLFFMGTVVTRRHHGALAQVMPALVAFVLNSGIFAIGLLSFANDLAVSRERGIFRRLRCAPVPSWFLLASLVAVQAVALLAQSGLVLVLAWHDGLRMTPGIMLLTLLVTMVSGLMALAFGLLIAALVRTASGVNAAGRLLFVGFVFLLEGSYGGTAFWPAWFRALARWSPVQLSQHLFASVLLGQLPSAAQALQVALILAWALGMVAFGLRYFQWQAQ